MTDNQQDQLPDWLQDVAGDKPEPTQAAPQARFSTTTIIIGVVVLAALAVIGYALYDSSQDQPVSGTAPDFTVTTFDFAQTAPYNDQRVSQAELEGDTVLVLNFWSRNCVTCKDEAPMLERVWQDYKGQGVLFLGVNIRDGADNALVYVRDHKLSFPSAPDTKNRVEDAYRIQGTPETFVIDRDGEIIKHWVGSMSENALRREIKRALVLGPAPDVSLTPYEFQTDVPLAGQTITLAELQGQVVVLNFWDSQCSVCAQEAPVLERVWRDYQDQDVVFLGAATGSDPGLARQFIATHGLSFPSAPAGEARQAFHVTGTPETFVLDRSGAVIAYFEGLASEKDLRRQIDTALAS